MAMAPTRIWPSSLCKSADPRLFTGPAANNSRAAIGRLVKRVTASAKSSTSRGVRRWGAPAGCQWTCTAALIHGWP